MSDFVIREAGPRDAELVASFIRELAVYEHVLEETDPSVEALRRDLAADANPRLYCFIAEVAGKPVGFAAYSLAYSTNRTGWLLHLQDLFVREAHRGYGIGTALFKHLNDVAVAKGYGWIELEVLEWNKDTWRFYKNLGGTVEGEMKKMYFDIKK